MAATRNEGKLAIDVYSRAQTSGEQITLGFVERHLDELRGGTNLIARAGCAFWDRSELAAVQPVDEDLGAHDRLGGAAALLRCE